MKIQYLLSEKTNINSFLYVLKILHKNFTEVLFNFNKTGMSISQFWEDKNTERAKYFFFFDTSFFSKISCPNENVFFRLSLKEILQKLKSHKKEIQEIYITVHNEPRDRMANESWCLVEFMVTLDKYGSMLYRNGCSLEKPGREFSPITYYQHLFANKELFFSVEPKKFEKIIGQFKGEYAEMYIKEDKMELSSLTYAQKINIKIVNCFKEFRYRKKNPL